MKRLIRSTVTVSAVASLALLMGACANNSTAGSGGPGGQRHGQRGPGPGEAGP